MKGVGVEEGGRKGKATALCLEVIRANVKQIRANLKIFGHI